MRLVKLYKHAQKNIMSLAKLNIKTDDEFKENIEANHENKQKKKAVHYCR